MGSYRPFCSVLTLLMVWASTATADFCYPGMQCFPSNEEQLHFAINMAGHVVFPYQPEYDATVIMQNVRTTKFPHMIATPFSTEEVQLSVLFARKYNLHMTIISSGHDYCGRSTWDGSFQISLRNMSDIVVNLSSSRHPDGEVTIGSGASWISVYEKINADIIYVKASCLSSMKGIHYRVYVCIQTTNGKDTVTHAYCQCTVGLSQSCSHVCCLLFYLANHKTDTAWQDNSCTSTLCSWNVPRASVKPQPLSTFHLSKEDHTPPAMTFDPRHSEDRCLDNGRILHELQKLKEIFPGTGMTHLWNIPDRAPDFLYEEDVSTYIDPLQRQMEQMVFSSDNLPPPVIDIKLSTYIEEHTRDQRNCLLWRELHKGRITSSIFGDVLSAGQQPNSLVKRIVEGSKLDKYDRLPDAIQWGMDHENPARVQYGQLKRAVTNLCIFPTGLTLLPTHTFLGASSDGRVFDCDREGLLEIKCPFSIGGIAVNEMEINKIADMNNNSFCLEMTNAGLKLKKTHKYYAQVQGEMAIMGLPWCDFVVWTAAKSNNIFIERVMFDNEHVSFMMPKLVQFYMDHVYSKFYI